MAIRDLGPDYISILHFYQNITYRSSMLKLKRDINQQAFWIVDLIMLPHLNNFHSLEVVDRVSETQLQVSKNSNLIIWRLKF